MSAFHFRRNCSVKVAAVAAVASLSGGHAIAGVADLASPTTFGQLKNQSAANEMADMYVQPRVTVSGIPVLPVAMTKSKRADAKTSASFVLACAEGSESSFFEQVNRDMGTFAYENAFRAFAPSGAVKTVRVSRMWSRGGDAFAYTAQWDMGSGLSVEALVRAADVDVSAGSLGKLTDNMVLFAGKVGATLGPQNNCRYAPPIDVVDGYAASLVPMNVESKDAKLLWFSAVDDSGTPFKAVIGRRFNGPAAAADNGALAKLELFGDVEGLLSYKTTREGYVSSVKFSSTSASKGTAASRQSDAVRAVLFERLGLPSAELVETNMSKAETSHSILWSGIRFVTRQGSASKSVGANTPVSWEVEFAQAPTSRLPKPE